MFRHFRQNQIIENKTGKPVFAKATARSYFKYAIGAIIFVVIGILIAENLAPTPKGGFSKIKLLKKMY